MTFNSRARKGAPIAPPGPIHESDVLLCNKMSFATEREAALFERSQQPYWCPLCSAWHLTSRRR